jgi:hypothetical protein
MRNYLSPGMDTTIIGAFVQNEWKKLHQVK